MRIISNWFFAVPLFALTALGGSTLHAQLDPFADDIQVRVLNVDVVVTDKKGAPVPGLGPEDFELLLDGKPIAVDYFSTTSTSISAAPAAGAPAAGAPDANVANTPGSASRADGPDRRLNLLIFIDRAHLRPGDMKDLKPALQRFLDEGLQTGDRVMLAVADQRVEILHDLTTIGPLVARALEDAGTTLGRGLRIESEYRQILRGIDQTFEEGNDLMARHPDQMASLLMDQINGFTAEAYRDVEITATQLDQVVHALSGVPGQNVVLYVSGRLPIAAGQSLFSAWQRAFGRNSVRWEMIPGAPGGGDAGPGGGAAENPADLPRFEPFEAMAALDVQHDASQVFEKTAAAASRKGVRLYTIDAAALRTSGASLLGRGSRALANASGGSQWEFDKTQRAAHRQALESLADETGGRSLAGSRDFVGVLGALRQDLDVSYFLGFEPPEGLSGTHEVRVRLRPPHKKLKVRHRRELLVRTVDEDAAQATLSALLFDTAENPLGVRLEPGAIASQGKTSRVPLKIRVPLTNLALVAEARAHSGRLTVFITSGDLERGVTPVQHAVVPVSIANREISDLLGRYLEYKVDVEVRRGSRAIAVGVRDDYASLFSTVTLPLPGIGSDMSDASDVPAGSR